MFFDSNPRALEKTVGMVSSAFERQMDPVDVYEHLTEPENLLLVQDQDEIIGMASYTSQMLGGKNALIIDGVAMHQKAQGRGIFLDIAREMYDPSHEYVCLRTQSPRMYKALDLGDIDVYPNKDGFPERLDPVREDFMKYLNCDIDENGVVKDFYGGPLYGKRPHHKEVDKLFDRFGLDFYAGDALLVVGEKKIQDMCD